MEIYFAEWAWEKYQKGELKGSFEFKEELEDVHMNIEAELINRLGDLGGKLHTARSRNAQVATDEKLYIKDKLLEVIKALREFRKSLARLAENSLEFVMPSYTHLQRAQPIRRSHYFLAYREIFLSDEQRVLLAYRSSDFLPLGKAGKVHTAHGAGI